MNDFQLAIRVYIVYIESFDRTTTGTFTLEFVSGDTILPTPTATRLFATSTATSGCGSISATVKAGRSNINVRRDPDRTSSIITVVNGGECFAIIGRTEDNDWLKIQLTTVRSGWIFADLVKVAGDLDAIPVLP